MVVVVVAMSTATTTSTEVQEEVKDLIEKLIADKENSFKAYVDTHIIPRIECKVISSGECVILTLIK